MSASNAFTHKYYLICVIDCYRCLPISQLAASSLSCAAAYRPILDSNIVFSRKYKHTCLIMCLRNLRYPLLIIWTMHPLCDLIYYSNQRYCVKFRFSLITLNCLFFIDKSSSSFQGGLLLFPTEAFSSSSWITQEWSKYLKISSCVLLKIRRLNARLNWIAQIVSTTVRPITAIKIEISLSHLNFSHLWFLIRKLLRAMNFRICFSP